jgi:predicted membrane-bound spermidine synthase
MAQQNRGLMGVVEIDHRQSAHNLLVVNRRGRSVDLDVAGATFASFHPEHLLTGYSWDALAAAPLLRTPPPQSLLLLGLGGGTCVRPLLRALPDLSVTGVELDGDVIALSRQHLGLDTFAIDVVIDDAERYLARTTARFDVIIDDLFLSGAIDVERSGDPTRERLARLQQRLNPGGLFVANFITDGAHRAVYKRGRRAFRETFRETAVVYPPRGLNAIVVGGERVGGREELLAYRDQFTSAHDRDLLSALRVRKLPRAG